MQAIETTYHGPTNRRGSRIKATCDAGTMWVTWDDNLDVEGNHVAAAKALAGRLGWSDRPFYSGGMKGRGYCHVFAYGKPHKVSP